MEFVEQYSNQELERLRGGMTSYLGTEDRAKVLENRERTSVKLGLGDFAKNLGIGKRTSTTSKSPDKLKF